jgi:hypothetical protein
LSSSKKKVPAGAYSQKDAESDVINKLYTYDRRFRGVRWMKEEQETLTQVMLGFISQFSGADEDSIPEKTKNSRADLVMSHFLIALYGGLKRNKKAVLGYVNEQIETHSGKFETLIHELTDKREAQILHTCLGWALTKDQYTSEMPFSVRIKKPCMPFPGAIEVFNSIERTIIMREHLSVYSEFTGPREIVQYARWILSSRISELVDEPRPKGLPKEDELPSVELPIQLTQERMAFWAHVSETWNKVRKVPLKSKKHVDTQE